MESYLAYLKSPAKFLRGFFCGVNRILDRFMKLAFTEARKGKDTWKNPQVGAVIVKNQQILSSGYHETYGQNHAEINALQHLPDISEAYGSTLYVTLEPCSHFGKTPPCVQKIVEVGIKKVVIAETDPNPIVSGNGIKYLESHGVQVENLHQKNDLNLAYKFFHQNNRPLVTIKYAMTLDGKVNQTKGTRSMITNQEVFKDSQELRRESQVILVGENTFKIDDPKLTVRKKEKFPPIRAVVIRDVNSVDLKRRIFQTSEPIYFFSQKKSSRILPKNVQVFVDDWTPLKIIQKLGHLGIQSILVEGGSHLQADFLNEKLCDRLVIYLANKIFGQGLPAINGPVAKLKFAQPEILTLADNLKITTWRLE
jgi:diaminohydroxyphosphoribosylaminopyrimidine deaminase/5-amino-6-(5-phosphoribosylamino)uracil reductase